MKLRRYVNQFLVAGSIALAGCDNSGQAPKKPELQVNKPDEIALSVTNAIELAVKVETRAQVFRVLDDCNHIKLTAEEIGNAESEIAKMSKALKDLSAKKDENIKKNPSQREEIENKYFTQKDSIESTYYNNPELERYFQSVYYKLGQEKCMIKSKLNKAGIEEYDRLHDEEIRLWSKMENAESSEWISLEKKETSEWSRLQVEKTSLWSKATSQEDKSRILSEYNQRQSNFLMKSNNKQAQMLSESNKKQADLISEYRKKKYALLDNSQYIK